MIADPPLAPGTTPRPPVGPWGRGFRTDHHHRTGRRAARPLGSLTGLAQAAPSSINSNLNQTPAAAQNTAHDRYFRRTMQTVASSRSLMQTELRTCNNHLKGPSNPSTPPTPLGPFRKVPIRPGKNPIPNSLLRHDKRRSTAVCRSRLHLSEQPRGWRRKKGSSTAAPSSSVIHERIVALSSRMRLRFGVVWNLPLWTLQRTSSLRRQREKSLPYLRRRRMVPVGSMGVRSN
ncbi:hypothetical protein QBC39DRAFT_53234 [Podospora conica]|nr:hypothetical protein QBC39DRAFT_53234 [Schizothecium conicum]